MHMVALNAVRGGGGPKGVTRPFRRGTQIVFEGRMVRDDTAEGRL